jgi:hypothetical protein
VQPVAKGDVAHQLPHLEDDVRPEQVVHAAGQLNALGYVERRRTLDREVGEEVVVRQPLVRVVLDAELPLHVVVQEVDVEQGLIPALGTLEYIHRARKE